MIGKHYEWKQVRYGSEPGKGDNIFWSDATGLGNGEMIANMGSNHHKEVRLLVEQHNAVISELQEANAALMTERTSLIAAKRDQLAALTAERDMWRDLALRGVK